MPVVGLAPSALRPTLRAPEFRVRLPRRERRFVRELPADGVECLDVLHHAAEIPVRVVLVADLVVAVRGVVRIEPAALLFAAVDEGESRTEIQYGYAHAREMQLVGAEEEALLRRIVR